MNAKTRFVAAALAALSPAVRADPAAVTAAPAPERRGAGEGVVSAGLLVGPSLPRPASVEVMFKLFRFIGLGASYGFMPRELSVALLSAASIRNAKADASGYDVEARIYPFAGSFFLGAALGRQRISVSTSDSQPAAVELVTSYLTPRLGWLATWSSGFSLGFDLGVQLTRCSDLDLQGPQVRSEIVDRARQLARTPLPSI